WAYIKGNNEEGDFSFIGTLHENDQAPSPRRANILGDYKTSTNIHSHYGTALYDFQPSGSDMSMAQRERERSPNAQFYIFSPLISKENYNKAVDGKYRTYNVPYKKINYEPGKYIPY